MEILQHKIIEMREEIVAARSEASELQERLFESNILRVQQENEIFALKNKNKLLEDELQAAQNSPMSDNVKSLDQSKSSMLDQCSSQETSSNDKLEKRIEKLSHQLDEQQAKNDKLSQDNKDLSLQLEKLKQVNPIPTYV